MSASVYLELALLNHVFKGTLFTQPANLHVALCTAPIADDATGATIVEPVGFAYSRIVANTWTIATLALVTSAKNTTAIVFPTATGSWGTITHVAILDAAVGGNLLAYGVLTTAKSVTTDDTPSFTANAFNITLE